MQKIWLLLLLPFLTQCSSSSSSASSSSAPLPTLSSPARAKAWGAPKVEKTASGYLFAYVNPSNQKEQLRISGSREMMPFVVYPPNIKGTKMIDGVATQVKTPQMWNKALVQKTTVKWYQSSFPTAKRAAEFRTLGAFLKDNSGGSGHYRIEAEGTKDQMRNWLSELQFGQ